MGITLVMLANVGAALADALIYSYRYVDIEFQSAKWNKVLKYEEKYTKWILCYERFLGIPYSILFLADYAVVGSEVQGSNRKFHLGRWEK